MLTEEYLKENLITSYFVDSERKNIEMLTTTDDKQKVFTTVLPYEENHPQYIALTKFMDIDKIHEATFGKKRKEREAFEESVMRIAKNEGLVFDSDKINSKFFPKLCQAIFEDVDNVDHLFALKLALFDVVKIRDSKNAKAKKTLRQAKNKIDVFQAAMDCLGKK
tara:strand:- start:278 stop:772 length:495 start_codon:yes stop_codon:yes gene_type:complete